MFSIDTFPCLQVSSMNRYRQEHVKPKLSRYAVKLYGEVEGMMQLTQDKRAIHIAVRATEGQVDKGIKQLNDMEVMVFEQIDMRSRGTETKVQYLSPKDLQASKNLEENIWFYSDKAVKTATEKRAPLVHPETFHPESVESVTLQQTYNGAGIVNTYAPK